MNETDIPCSDCGTDLVDRTVQTHDLPVSTDWSGEVTVAICPTCEARYYPDRTLTQLFNSPSATRSLEDT
jgi:hypothetical protein